MTSIISLGSSCDTANQLKRLNINNAHYFFDFIWNEYSGLDSVTKIIQEEFESFKSINNYTKSKGRLRHPIVKGNFHINKNYPTILFMHHDTSKQEVIESINRKITRTKDIFSNNNKKLFIYYRHYYWDFNPCNDLNILINESQQFCEMYKNKYDNNFCLLSLITYDSKITEDTINDDLKNLRANENSNLKFDFVYRRDDDNKEIYNIYEKSWDAIFKKYICGGATPHDAF